MSCRRLNGVWTVTIGLLACCGLTGMVLTAAGASLPLWGRAAMVLAVVVVALDGTIEGVVALTRRLRLRRQPPAA